MSEQDDDDTYPDGWLTLAEIRQLKEMSRNGVVLEVGAYVGRSTVALAEAAFHVVSVDHHQGSLEHQLGQPQHDERYYQRTLPALMANIEARALRSKVSICVMDSAWLWLFRPSAFDFAFVDASHDYECVLRDGRLALGLVRPGAYLAFHDYDSEWREVRAAVDALAQGADLKVEKGADSIGLVRKRS